MSGTLTVGDYLERWLAHVAPSLQQGTVRSYRGRVSRLKHELGAVRLTRLTAHRVDQTRQASGRGLSPATIECTMPFSRGVAPGGEVGSGAPGRHR
jgi:hypothetical protein